MSAEGTESTSTALGRRRLLRGGAVLATAAAGAAAVAMAPATAHAADGDPLVAGETTEATAETTLRIGGEAGDNAPALGLENADGPSLRLQPLSSTWPGELQPGEMAGTDLGPIVGVETPDGVTTTYLITAVDLANVATPFAARPSRILDLRTEAGRDAIVRRKSAGSLATDGRLRAGEWIDIAIILTGSDYSLEAVFGNLTVTGPLRAGYATLYPPGIPTGTSSLNFAAGQTVANAAFVGTGEVQGAHVVRLSTTADAWLLLDITGGITQGNVQTPLKEAARAQGGRASLVRRLRTALGRAAR